MVSKKLDKVTAQFILSEEQTLLAKQRTMLAFIQTGLGFIGMGLIVAKFFGVIIFQFIGSVLILIGFYEMVEPLVKAGVPVDKIRGLSSIVEIMRLKERKGIEWIDKVKEGADSEVNELAKQYELST